MTKFPKYGEGMHPYVCGFRSLVKLEHHKSQKAVTRCIIVNLIEIKISLEGS